MPKSRMAVLDSNVFISSHKGNEPFSQDCTALIKKVMEGKLILAEPAILLAEVIDAIGRYAGRDDAAEAEKILRDLVTFWVDCEKDFCIRSGHLGYSYKIYGCDAIYVQVATDLNAPFISLDIEDLVQKLKMKGFSAYSVKEFLELF